MSYWSENPEAYDECERKGIARKLASWLGFEMADEQESFESDVEYIIDQLNHSREPGDKKLMDALREWANAEIVDRTNTYFERFIP